MRSGPRLAYRPDAALPLLPTPSCSPLPVAPPPEDPALPASLRQSQKLSNWLLGLVGRLPPCRSRPLPCFSASTEAGTPFLIPKSQSDPFTVPLQPAIGVTFGLGVTLAAVAGSARRSPCNPAWRRLEKAIRAAALAGVPRQSLLCGPCLGSNLTCARCKFFSASLVFGSALQRLHRISFGRRLLSRCRPDAVDMAQPAPCRAAQGLSGTPLMGLCVDMDKAPALTGWNLATKISVCPVTPGPAGWAPSPAAGPWRRSAPPTIR